MSAEDGFDASFMDRFSRQIGAYGAETMSKVCVSVPTCCCVLSCEASCECVMCSHVHVCVQ